jgi:hypothetical protein
VPLIVSAMRSFSDAHWVSQLTSNQRVNLWHSRVFNILGLVLYHLIFPNWSLNMKWLPITPGSVCNPHGVGHKVLIVTLWDNASFQLFHSIGGPSPYTVARKALKGDKQKKYLEFICFLRNDLSGRLLVNQHFPVIKCVLRTLKTFPTFQKIDSEWPAERCTVSDIDVKIWQEGSHVC